MTSPARSEPRASALRPTRSHVPSVAAERSPAGDDPASRVAALFDACCGFVCRVLRHHGVHEAALDDAVQDVFVTAYRRWSSFEGRSSARSWLYGIARRIAFRYRRSADARARRFVPAADASIEPVDEPFARAHAAQSLAALLHTLDDDKRTVLVLTELEGMTAPEVAEALGIPLGTAYSRLRAAWQVLGRQAGCEEQRLRRALPAMREPEPSPERRRHMWSLVAGGIRLPAEGTSAAAAATRWMAQVKWIAVGAALGAGLLGARAAMVTAERRQDVAARSLAAEPAKGSRSTPAAATATGLEAAGAPGASPATTAIEPTSPQQREAFPAARPGMPVVIPASATPTEAPAAPTPAPAETPAPPPDDTLAAELALVQQARVAVREGRTDDALVLLDQHARRFPRGQLVDERRALEGEAGRSEPPR